ncbi:hypothetical protein MESS4_530095 [Mesorhizobium sp. STM 4661]|nr:hypothetical protein MESS4_530095 [Mesorhizobium sp. STM 4661]
MPEARGKGIGRRAMAFLKQRLAARGSTGLCLVVIAGNHGALDFYKAISFEVVQDPGLPKHYIYVAKRLTLASEIAG